MTEILVIHGERKMVNREKFSSKEVGNIKKEIQSQISFYIYRHFHDCWLLYQVIPFDSITWGSWGGGDYLAMLISSLSNTSSAVLGYMVAAARFHDPVWVA